ncbi:nitroreductase/quinone reductase family protein [Mycobacterium sp. IDR2000157661]|uniref:nitroreductase/quinone reductase family protein n=1 Tax=Mycobacterium sp. IDR2000157661 TaxID=2867005 RepID=UPI001EEB9E7D|nr:nitroreductase/quinone reductase family protein [Mycobacterium sp. IDR2000157661]ULE33404.1 nitroreductase/quinone reductase family protein [Mycobacterium sp. IDR2000157661]
MPSSAVTSVKNTVRTFNKYLLNPVMMHLAGRRHWYASVIRHVGRRSGYHYATPVVADRVDDGFIIPLPYGTHVDWLRNVQASGEAVVTYQGRDYDVADPQLLDRQAVTAQLPRRRAQVFERLGVEQFLKLSSAA